MAKVRYVGEKREMITRRKFLQYAPLVVAPVFGGCAGFPDDKPLVRFGVFADAHYADAPSADGRFYALSKARVAEAAATFAAHGVDFAIELGDFKDLARTEDGKPDPVRTAAFADEVEAAFATFPGPRHHVLGNHEMDVLNKDEILAHFTNTGFARALPHYSFSVGGVTFIVLDACFNAQGEDYAGTPCNWTWTESTVPPAEIDWLRAELARAPGLVAVFIHQRLDSAARAHHRVKNAEEVQRVLAASGKVAGVFQGHDHVGGFARECNLSHYTFPAMVEGADENRFAEVAVYPSGNVAVTDFGIPRLPLAGISCGLRSGNVV